MPPRGRCGPLWSIAAACALGASSVAFWPARAPKLQFRARASKQRTQSIQWGTRPVHNRLHDATQREESFRRIETVGWGSPDRHWPQLICLPEATGLRRAAF